jgi:hypothetical protein
VAGATAFSDSVVGFALVAAALGWQASVSVLLLTSILRLMTAWWSGRFAPYGAPSPLLYLLPATFAHICFWRQLDRLSWWPGSQSSVPGLLLAAIAALLLAWAAHEVEARRWADKTGTFSER